MCGIAGFWHKNYDYDIENTISSMTDTIINRGPDDAGVWVNKECGIAFGHRRLSIIDLSSHGHQPMHSNDKRYVLTYNGEIYNFKLLKKELLEEGCHFTGNSDTEVLLNAIQVWGIEKALQKSIGMFAFALWDNNEKKLYLARDRMGIKPLYYGWQGECFMFASGLKAFHKHSAFRKEINPSALNVFLNYSYIPSPYSIFKGIYKLPPGNFACVDENKNVKQIKYWSLPDKVIENVNNRQNHFSLNESTQTLNNLLNDAVKLRTIADVPVGTFLSGGVDSSLISAIMQSQSHSKIRTFTIGFKEKEFNEANYAKKIAEHLGTDHHELILTADDLTAVIPNIPHIYDEPFADSSQIPTFLISQLAKSKVKVCLSGDGGDELFGGYNKYMIVDNLWDKIHRFPKFSRDFASKSIRTLNKKKWDKLFSLVRPVFPKKHQYKNFGDKLYKLGNLITSNDSYELYRKLVTQPCELNLLKNSPPQLALETDKENWLDCLSFIENMMYIDSRSYLPGDILTKVDRASMSVSLEARVPLLDHRIVEYAWSLPMSSKINAGDSKVILKNVLYNYLPKKLIERPKMGFSMPIRYWLRGPLKNWANDLLSDRSLAKHNLLDQAAVKKKWNQHLSAKHDWHKVIWNVLMFQAWHAHYYD